MIEMNVQMEISHSSMNVHMRNATAAWHHINVNICDIRQRYGDVLFCNVATLIPFKR